MIRVPVAKSFSAPLIQQNENGLFEAVGDTLAWINTLEAPLRPVVISGRARKGKSFLMNMLLEAPPRSNFEVGSTTNSCTRGLWVSKKTLPAKDGGTILFVDTEGIDHANSTSESDLKIMGLALLVTSQFCFNSVGAIEETSVATLAMVSKLCERIGFASQHASLVWLLRDFALDMRSQVGDREITPDAYLEDVLMVSSSVPCNKDARLEIAKAFRTRKCFVFDRPSSDDQKLPELERWPDQIKPSFKAQVAELREYLREHAGPVKLPSGQVVQTTVDYTNLCSALAEQMNAQEFKCNLFEVWQSVETARWDALAGQFSAQLERASCYKDVCTALTDIIKQAPWTESADPAGLTDAAAASLARIQGSERQLRKQKIDTIEDFEELVENCGPEATIVAQHASRLYQDLADSQQSASLESQKAAIESLEEQLALSREVEQRLHASVADLETELVQAKEELQARPSSASDGNGAANPSVAAAEREASLARASLEAEQKSNAMLQKTLKQMRSRTKEAENDRAKMVAEIAGLTHRLAQAEKVEVAFDSFQDKVLANLKQHDRAAEQLMLTLTEATEKKLQQALAAEHEVKVNYARLSAEANSKKRKLEQMEADHKTQGARAVQTEARLAKAEAELHYARTSLKAAEERNKSLLDAMMT